MDAIAVVIPCRDMGRTLPEALASVRAQTRPADEIVVVDDGSTDALTLQVLARLEETAAPVRVLRTPHGGVAAARNAGIAATRAPCIVPLDADDWLEPTYLDRASDRLGADPALDFVSCGMQAFGGASYTWTPTANGLVGAFSRGVVHQSTLFRRRVWEAVGGYDPASGWLANFDFWLSALGRGFRGTVLPEPLLHYRVRSGSMYHGPLERGEFWPALEAVLRKHRAAIERLGPELLLAKEEFLLEQQAHSRHLHAERDRLQGELAAVNREIAELERSLREKGGTPLDWGELRRLTPVSPVWGLDRGGPLDRYYIEGFLERHGADVHGRVLEVKDSTYTRRFGADRITRADVLDIDPGNPQATIVADLQEADVVPEGSFDCFILTQTLHIVYDTRAALAHARRILKPGGVLLCTVPAVSRINYEDGGLDHGDYWRFTEASLRRLFCEVFAPEAFEVIPFGNVLACVAFLHGLAPGELTRAELDHTDPWFPLLYGIRAVKPGERR